MSSTQRSATLPVSPAVVGESLLAQAVEASADAVFCQDAGGRVITWNAAAERLYGYPAADIVGHRADELLAEGTREEIAAASRSALSGSRVERFDSVHRRADGILVPVNVSSCPLRDKNGTVVATATTVADISERVALAKDLERVRTHLQRRNAALLRSNRDLEQFAYVASHDLSEPLRVMAGYVARLEAVYGHAVDERGARYVAHVVDACARMRSLIDDLLEYSRFLRAPRQSAAVDLARTVERVLSTLAGPVREAQATVEVGDLPVVWADATHLESLLLNLVSNALKFRSPGEPARVRVSATVDGGWVTLVVEDAGIGIEPQYRERVFRMFQRLHVREAYPGTGIGLAIAQQVVELLDGRIWVEDSPLGGARFCAVLPSVPPEDAHA